LWAALLLVLVLAACGTGEDGKEQATAGGPATATVSVWSSALTAGLTATDVARPTGFEFTTVPVLATQAVPTSIPPTPTSPAPLAAAVNGQYIVLADYERRVGQYEMALLRQGLDPDSEEGSAALAQMRQDVLEGMIDNALIEQGAESLGLSLSDAEVEVQIEADIIAGGGQSAFGEWLQATGQTREDYKGMVRGALLSQAVAEVVAEVVPAEAEQVHLRQIVVDSEEQALEILALLQAGAEFAELARERSVAAGSEDDDGDLGWCPRGVVAPELERAAFALQAGRVSDVVRVGEGYYIVQVVEREPARTLSAAAQLNLRRAAFELWLEDVKMTAEIERFVVE
jgi:parvulin-like peptidyl-prolyl isomerase